MQAYSQCGFDGGPTGAGGNYSIDMSADVAYYRDNWDTENYDPYTQPGMPTTVLGHHAVERLCKKKTAANKESARQEAAEAKAREETTDTEE